MQTTDHWVETNQRQLMAALGRVREALARHAGDASSSTDRVELTLTPQREDANSAGAIDSNPEATAGTALANLCAIFSLSPFERDILLLCAGVELDSAFAAACVEASGDPRRSSPTFGQLTGNPRITVTT